MRRLLAAAAFAAAALPAAPADATCTPYHEGTRVCAQVVRCGPELCEVHPVVDGQCKHPDPAPAYCSIVEEIYLDLGKS